MPKFKQIKINLETQEVTYRFTELVNVAEHYPDLDVSSLETEFPNDPTVEGCQTRLCEVEETFQIPYTDGVYDPGHLSLMVAESMQNAQLRGLYYLHQLVIHIEAERERRLRVNEVETGEVDPLEVFLGNDMSEGDLEDILPEPVIEIEPDETEDTP